MAEKRFDWLAFPKRVQREVFTYNNFAQLLIGLVGTFVGVFLAFWLDRSQQEASAQAASRAVLSAALNDCQQSLAVSSSLTSDWDGASLPPQQLPASTWAALILNAKILESISPESQQAIATDVFAAQRSLFDYNKAAEEFRLALMARPTVLPPPGVTPSVEIPPQLQRMMEESDQRLAAASPMVTQAAEEYHQRQKAVCDELTTVTTAD